MYMVGLALLKKRSGKLIIITQKTIKTSKKELLHEPLNNRSCSSSFQFPYSLRKISKVCELAPNNSDLSHVDR